MRKRYALPLLVLLLRGFAAFAGSPPPIVLRAATDQYALGRHWEILIPPPAVGAALTLAQVRAAPYADQFRPSTADVPNVGLRQGTYWLRCRLRAEGPAAGPAASSWVLVSPSERLNPTMYLVAPDGRVQPLAADPHRPAVPGLMQCHAALPLVPGLTYELYVRPTTNQFLYTIYPFDAIARKARLRDVEASLYFGLLIGLILYNLLLYFSVRDRSYLYYVLFTSSFGLVQFEMLGHFQQFDLYRLLPWSAHQTHNVLVGLTMLFSLLTVRAFLDTAQRAPRLDRLLRAALLLALLPVLALPLGRLANALFWVGMLSPIAVCLVITFVGTRLLLTGSRAARYLMAGWLALIFAVVWFYLSTIGLLPVNFISLYGVRLASALEVVLLSLGLADRINQTRRERDQVQALAMAALREKEEVQRAANQVLTERAAELQRAYADLQQSLTTTGHLRELDELKTRFFTNVSHELRTPLTLILGPLEELLDGRRPPDAEATRAAYALMHRHAERLLTLINQLLDVARLEAGQLRLNPQPVDPAAFLRLRVGTFSSAAAQRGIRLELREAVTKPRQPFFADPDQLEKILDNLLANALKFTPAGGGITVALHLTATHAVITVRDTGIGIGPHHLPYVFDRFYQADDSPQRPHGGSGIGLALVKELVALHHGTVAVTSTVGEGTCFTVELPLGPPPAPSSPPALLSEGEGEPNDLAVKPPPSEGVGGGPPSEGIGGGTQAGGFPILPAPEPVAVADSAAAADQSLNHSIAQSLNEHTPLVIIVDDHADMRDYLAHCLGDDFRVLTAPDGEAGLARIAEELPDLVISDLMMPHLDGLELCRRLKTDERTSHIPVILLTARTNDQSRLSGLELGADDYLTKPFRPAELLVRAHNLLRQRRLLRERFSREVTLQPKDISITPADEVFLTRALALVETHIADADFDTEAFASALALSRSQLFRKLKALTDQSPTDFVRTLRLRRAARLLEQQLGNVADVAYAVGFNNLSYFSKCFREQFGYPPSEHLARVGAAM